MSGNKGPINRFLIFGLSIPFSILYIALIVLTSTSFAAAVLGYMLLGISFGLSQSLFEIKHSYRVAFLSTLIIPVLAYLMFAVMSILILQPHLCKSHFSVKMVVRP
jgi:hypothetical protein